MQHTRCKITRTSALLFIFLACYGLLPGQSQRNFQPLQRASGFGGTNYPHAGVQMEDYGAAADGYWLFLPEMPRPDSAQVVVLLHGYGCYNPMIYGKWIKHLVRKGNIVIYPRYQQTILKPRTKDFTPNAAQGIRDALARLEGEGMIHPFKNGVILAGHSYGGVIGANLVIHHTSYEIPQPLALLAVAPGTSYLKGGLLDSYTDLPETLKLVVVVSDDDKTTGDKYGTRLYEAAEALPDRLFLRQYADDYGLREITAGHDQAYCVDLDFDSGVRNYSARKALRLGVTDPIDYNGYWKLMDALIACAQSGAGGCSTLFDRSDWESFLGVWSDGTPLRALEPLPLESEAAIRITTRY